MTDELSAPTPTSLTIGDLQAIEDRRSQPRILAFCQVLSVEGELIGVSFDLTPQGVCLSLPNTWPDTNPFAIKLKRIDNPDLPTITITVQSMWRNSRNDNFDEIGGKILQVDSPERFDQFLTYCHSAGPSGLIDSLDSP